MRLYKQNNSGTIGYWEISVTDNAELRIAHARSEGAKEVVRLIPCKGKNIGRANETTDHEQAVKEMASRIKKQKDKGYCETVEEAAKGVSNSLGLPKPTLAVVYNKVKPERIDWKSAWLQVKVDGNRCLFKDGVLYSRGGKIIDLPHIVEAIKKEGWDHLHLDGELYVDHQTTLQQLSSLIKRPREESLTVKYLVFDVVSEESFEERFVKGLPQPQHSNLYKIPSEKVEGPGEVMELHGEFVSDGWEGAILRHGLQGYETDKRSQNLLKIKEYLDAEAEVIGVEEGTPHGDFRIPVWVLKNPFGGADFRVTAEGTMAEKNKQWECKDSFIGKIITFKYFMLSDDKVPLQPVALGWRE